MNACKQDADDLKLDRLDTKTEIPILREVFGLGGEALAFADYRAASAVLEWLKANQGPDLALNECPYFQEIQRLDAIFA